MKAILLLALSAIILSQSYGFVYADHGGSSHANINVLENTSIDDPIIIVTTDSTSYETGEIVNVSGSVSDYDASDPMVQPVITLTFLDPKNNIISISQLSLNDDGSYSTSILAQGPLWKFDGEYTISVSHGSDKNASTTFAFTIPEVTEVVEEIIVEEVAGESTEEVLADKCGPGTHLEDGVCILDESSSVESTSTEAEPASTNFNSWIYSITFTLLIAFVIAIFLYLISRVRGKKTV